MLRCTPISAAHQLSNMQLQHGASPMPNMQLRVLRGLGLCSNRLEHLRLSAKASSCTSCKPGGAPFTQPMEHRVWYKQRLQG